MIVKPILAPCQGTTKNKMTKIKNNAMLKNLSGKFGDTHQYRKVRGKMLMVNLPDSSGVASEKQKATKEKFTKAASYAKAQMADDDAKALYKTGVTGKKFNAYLVAVSDWLNAPKVNEIKTGDYVGEAGDQITIDASDDFKVVRVRVIMTDGVGNKLERGEAIQDAKNAGTWRYTATVANPAITGTTISVTAFDLPDNEATLVKVLE